MYFMEPSQTSQATLELPIPRLAEGRFASIVAYTDEALFDACGVRIAFTERGGGESQAPFDSLNLGSHVGDCLEVVLANREHLLSALGFEGACLVVPTQVHGDKIISFDTTEEAEALLSCSGEHPETLECDAISVTCDNVAAQLNFADCVPVIAVAPTGDFSVIHAGWRGVDNQISAKAVEQLAHDVAERTGLSPEQVCAQTNIYIGPHIMGECFETSEEIHDEFVRKFGSACDVDARHVELSQALICQLLRTGVVRERIVSLGLCTVCNNDRFFSYRGQGGVCGRHGAFAARKPKE